MVTSASQHILASTLCQKTLETDDKVKKKLEAKIIEIVLSL